MWWIVATYGQHHFFYHFCHLSFNVYSLHSTASMLDVDWGEGGEGKKFVAWIFEPFRRILPENFYTSFLNFVSSKNLGDTGPLSPVSHAYGWCTDVTMWSGCNISVTVMEQPFVPSLKQFLTSKL